MGFLKKAKKKLGKGMKSVKAPFKKKRRKRKFPAIMSKDFVTIVVIAIIVGGIVAVAALQPDIIFLRPDWAYDTTTTDTTTDTTTTTTTTTTSPEEDDLYIIRFRFDWGDSIAEEDKCWLEFSVYDYHDITPTGRRDMATFAAAATLVWYPGSWGAEFTEGESLSIGMASYSGWYNLEDPFYVDVSVGPWSHEFTFYSYKYGFSVALTGTLMINWELV